MAAILEQDVLAMVYCLNNFSSVRFKRAHSRDGLFSQCGFLLLRAQFSLC